jgi:ABC-type uncharacterized transport system auxiliary subunit
MIIVPLRLASLRVALLLAAPLLSGCIGSAPPLERYRLTPMPAPAATATATALTDSSARVTIAVEPYATTGIYADPQIVYRVGESTYGAYPNREWALPLGTMLADATVETLRATPGLGAQVTTDGVAAAHGLVWRGTVQRFEEIDRHDGVAAAVELDAVLVRTPGDTVVWQGSVALERGVAEPGMPAIVSALSELTSAALRRLVDESRGAVGADTVRLSQVR